MSGSHYYRETSRNFSKSLQSRAHNQGLGVLRVTEQETKARFNIVGKIVFKIKNLLHGSSM